MRRIARGNLEVDRDAFEVRIDGMRVDLTFIEFELLCQLASRPGRVVRQEELAAALWGEQATGSVGKLRVHMSRLRRKVEASHPWRITTVRRRGYALVEAAEGERARTSRARNTAVTRR